MSGPLAAHRAVRLRTGPGPRPRCRVRRPPQRSRASRHTVSRPAATRAEVAARPAILAPTTTTSCLSRWSMYGSLRGPLSCPLPGQVINRILEAFRAAPATCDDRPSGSRTAPRASASRPRPAGAAKARPGAERAAMRAMADTVLDAQRVANAISNAPPYKSSRLAGPTDVRRRRLIVDPHPDRLPSMGTVGMATAVQIGKPR